MRARLRASLAYWWPALGFCSTMTIIAAQASGATASLSERLIWLIILAVFQVFYALEIHTARHWERIADTWAGTAARWRDLYRQVSPDPGAAIMGDLFPDGQPLTMPWCRKCDQATESADGICGHKVCNICGRCPPCDGPWLPKMMPLPAIL